MNEKILYKKELPKFYEEIADKYNFFAPVKDKNNIYFKKIENPDEILLTYFNSKIPPKEILFPRNEILFKYEYEGDKVKIIKPDNIEEKNAIFGIRPCDANSFKILEKIFASGKFKDDLFLKKKENSLLIAIGCNNPKKTCFCTSVYGGPFRKEDVDLFLTDLGDKFLIQPISEKGKEILNPMRWLTDAGEKDLETALELAKQAESKIKTQLNLKDIDKIMKNIFNHEIWNDISSSCLGCGTCAFLCPTCHCFDVIDEHDHYNNKGARIRIWDTCQFCIYTLHTSGHNPRPTQIERCRNRILHKFSYIPENFNTIGCVGCGRCVQYCPVNNDLRLIIEKIRDLQIKDKKEEMIVV
ncbi:MAG: 4Fe-4S dicluster domain-containing protein [Promethearchaeota archaeon]